MMHEGAVVRVVFLDNWVTTTTMMTMMMMIMTMVVVVVVEVVVLMTMIMVMEQWLEEKISSVVKGTLALLGNQDMSKGMP